MNTEWTIAPTRNGQAHEIRIHPPGGVRGGSSLRFPALLQAESREGGKVTVAIDEATATENGIRAFGKSELFQAETRFTRRSGECSYFDVAAEVVYTGARPAEWTLQVEAELLGEGRPDWMIPGAFYKENRFETNLRLYPRYDYEGGDASGVRRLARSACL